jgi:uncharacterized membrane protein YphA (DoxX/SURF4 family)
MPLRQALATNVAPLILRLALGVTFLWAGLGKFNAYDAVKGDQAARLANVGVITASGDAPSRPEADKGDHAGPESTPPKPDQPAAPPAAAQPPQPKLMYAAADFPTEVRVRRLHTAVTLRLLEAADPPTPAADTNPEPATPRRLWPASLAGSKAPLFAWGVAILDVVGGLCLLLGLLTRLWAFLLAGHMAVGLWLLVVGPAWAAGNVALGFLPRHDPWDLTFWIMPLWIVALIAMNLALACLGAGSLSLDRPLLGEAVRPGSRPTQ